MARTDLSNCLMEAVEVSAAQPVASVQRAAEAEVSGKREGRITELIINLLDHSLDRSGSRVSTTWV